MPPVADVLDITQLRRSCASCGLRELCLPAGINGDDLARLDATVRDKRTLERGKALYRVGDAFHSLFVVRSGALKTFVLNEEACQQVIGFHLPGEIVGVDALASGRHASQAEALERTSICELPFSELERVTSQIPTLHRQLLRVISREVVQEHQHLVTMGQQQAQVRLAIFLKSLADRYETLHRDGSHLMLPMSRQDIASYLGLVVETVSRLFTRFETMGILAVQRKSVTVLRPDLLAQLCRPVDGDVATGKASQPASN
ncbi:MAG TPA: helix-turn-helix domain-containing protein [Dyella sp.]|uniref:helix-turn-helix domain-containing protein n=1 Tax=Dyella sp. TaxID=1869338 RepID=UPI002D787705|nr:helix-turn-helix domain-containing protein [Dyella sp.]HET6553077.1 helix-turn-helix domain-containing protein [Dyella sp.]